MINRIIKKEDLNKVRKELVKAMVNELKKSDKKATGDLIKSIKGEIKNNQIIMVANHYLKYVDEGRKPGKYPPIAPLKKWAKIKLGDESIGYAVQRSIYKKGIKKTDVINKAFKVFIDKMGPDIEKLVEANIIDSLDLIIQDINKKNK